MTSNVHIAPLSAAPVFPWRRPRREPLVIVLVALATLTPLYVLSAQDISRLCLTESLLAGRLSISHRCVGRSIDRARYAGRFYSDKAPGMSVLAVPAVELTRTTRLTHWQYVGNRRVWLVRVLTGGIAFIVLVFILGRVAEGLAAGTGGLTAVTFALGTLAGALAATMFDQVTAAALGFGAFLLAWRARPGWAGVLAGLAVLVEYQAALVALVIGIYLALRGVRSLGRYAAGALLGVAALAAYDWAAFGSPFHASYRYIANAYARAQASGFFGISMPRGHAVDLVLIGDRGLLVASPVVVAAAAGLLMLMRRCRREAVVCAAVTVLFLVLEFGYFLPYGGVSPGPRFLTPALPFLALGLAPAFKRFRAVTNALAAASIVACTAVMLTWSWESTVGYRQTVWGELARLVTGSCSRLGRELTGSALHSLGLDRVAATAFVAACAFAAFACAWPWPHRRRPLRG